MTEAAMAAKIEQLEQRLATMASFQHRSHSRGEAPTSYGGDDLFYMASVAQIEASVAVMRNVTRTSEPRGATMELDPQRGEAGRQARLPQSFLLSEVVRTPSMVPTPPIEPTMGPTASTSSVDSPWQAVAVKMDALPARLAIDRERFTPGVCMLDNQNGIFRLVSPTGQVYRPNRVLLDSGAQPLMLGKAACIGLGIRRLELEPCPFQIQTSLGGASDRSNFMTREKLSVHMKLDHVTDSSRLGVTVLLQQLSCMMY